ncbi:hypothetical protein DFS34DRAFT_369193 [Phlyctochytrium arcticum]|nr:hypothetical protein DFS34DRAFT_369193 [Phlyctochytrium arcticum]
MRLAKNHTLKNVVNLSGSHPVFLCSNLLVNGTKLLTDFSNESQSILAAITPDSFGDVISWTNPSSDFLLVGDNITNISFFLVDSLTSQEILLNGPLTFIQRLTRIALFCCHFDRATQRGCASLSINFPFKLRHGKPCLSIRLHLKVGNSDASEKYKRAGGLCQMAFHHHFQLCIIHIFFCLHNCKLHHYFLHISHPNNASAIPYHYLPWTHLDWQQRGRAMDHVIQQLEPDEFPVVSFTTRYKQLYGAEGIIFICTYVVDFDRSSPCKAARISS